MMVHLVYSNEWDYVDSSTWQHEELPINPSTQNYLFKLMIANDVHLKTPRICFTEHTYTHQKRKKLSKM